VEERIRLAVVLEQSWESYKTIKVWKTSLARRSYDNIISTGTYNAMKVWFPRFLETTIDHDHPNGLNPDELIAEAINDPYMIETRLYDAYYYWIEKQKSPDKNCKINNARIGIFGNVRGFYSRNLPFKTNFSTPREMPRLVMTTDAITPLTEISTNSRGEKIVDLDRKLIGEYFERMTLRDQTIMTGLISSGMDSGDLAKITVGMIKEQEAHDRIFISNFRNKSGEIINTFLSKEATRLARKLIKMERKNAPDDAPLFVVGLNPQKKAFYNKYNRQCTKSDYHLLEEKALIAHQISRNFRRIAEHMIKLKKGVQSPMRPKKFRKLFSDACDKAGIGDNKRKIFMGKKSDSNSVYAGRSRHELEIYYELVEQYITIDKKDPAILNDLKEATTNLAKANLENDILQRNITDLYQKFEGLQKQIK